MAAPRLSPPSRRLVAPAVLLIILLAAPVAADTLLRMTSDPGDYIGLGESYLYTPAQGSFSGNGPGPVARVSFSGSSHYWNLEFRSPYSRTLAPGIYTGAVRSPFVGLADVGLEVTGDSRGCNTLTGSFQVRQVQRSGDTITAFWATFEQHCEGSAAALRGEIRLNADTSIYVGSPSDVVVTPNTPVHFDVQAVDAAGLPIVLTPGGVPPGATFTDHGDGTGTFDWPSGPSQVGETNLTFTATSGPATATSFSVVHSFEADLLRISSEPGDYIGGGGEYLFTRADGAFTLYDLGPSGAHAGFSGSGQAWNLDFAAPSGHPLTPGVYLGAHRYPFQASSEPGLDISSFGRGCNTLTGQFVIRQIGYDSGNHVNALWATFEQHCEGGVPKLSGEIRINADTSLSVTAPADITVPVHDPVHFDVQAVDVNGYAITLTTDPLPSGATFTDHHDGTGSFDWPGGPDHAGDVTVVVHAGNTQGKSALTATTIHAFGPDLLHMVSDPGDYIGQGQTYHLTRENGTFQLRALVVRGAEVSFDGSGQSWDLDFIAPFGRALEPGIYTGAFRSPFQSTSDPGLSVTGNGRGCNQLTGQFQIRQVAVDASNVPITLWATFEQHCEGLPAKLLGEVRISADTAIYVGSPADVFTPPGMAVAFDIVAQDTRGFGVQIEAGTLPPGATFTDHGDGTATFAWSLPEPAATVATVTFTARSAHGEQAYTTSHIHVLNPTFLDMVSDPGDYIGGGQHYHFTSANTTFNGSQNYAEGVSIDVAGSGHNFHLDFSAPGNQPLAPGTYFGAVRFPFNGPTQPGLSVSGDGRGCNTITGMFTVKEVTYGDAGALESFWASFEQHCEGGAPRLTGELYFVQDRAVPVLATVIETDASPDRVHLRWYSDVHRGEAATVYRRGEDSPWASIATIVADGSGSLEVSDTDVEPGERYGYRLGWGSGSAATFSDQVWIDVPREQALELALDPVRPNPARASQFSVSFVKPSVGSASLDLIDVAGRSVIRRDLAGLTPGRHTLTISEAGGLTPGFYILRLRAGDRVATRRAFVIR